MYDDLTVEQLISLRTDIRLAYHALISGQQAAEIRYGEHGETFHPASPELCELTIARINATITRKSGGRSGAIIPVVG